MPGRLDPAGSLGPADRPSAKRGHAGHARQLRTQHQESGVRPARGRGHAFRRPRDGESRAFRRQRQGDPPGDRPRGDRQDHPGRRGGRGRCETLPAAHHRAYPQTRPQPMDRRIPRLRPDRIRSRHPQGRAPRRGAYPHGRGGRRRGPGLPQRRGAGDRRGPAADERRALFRIPPHAQRGHLGRSRHDGIRTSGGHRGPSWAPPTAKSSFSPATAACK